MIIKGGCAEFNLVSRNFQNWYYWHFCITSDENKLEIHLPTK